jgi:hypothetical protein
LSGLDGVAMVLLLLLQTRQGKAKQTDRQGKARQGKEKREGRGERCDFLLTQRRPRTYGPSGKPGGMITWSTIIPPTQFPEPVEQSHPHVHVSHYRQTDIQAGSREEALL